MDTEIAKLWVEKLRSGQFPQGTGFLCANDKFCCLGVLCELYDELNPGKVLRGLCKEKSMDGNLVQATSFDNCVSVLPVKIRDWAKMKSTSGDVDGFLCLAELNDKGESFEKIADIIEQKVDEL